MDIDSSEIALQLCELDSLSVADLEAKIIGNGNRLMVDMPLHSVDRTNDPADIADDYLDASYFAERLAPHCASIEVTPVRPKYGLTLRFCIVPSNMPALIHALRQILPWFISDIREPDDSLRDDVAAFSDGFLEAKVRVHVLADNYMANFLAGSRYCENRRKWHRKHPTWRWGFWRSFAADQLRCEVYTSSELDGAWIVLGGRATVERLLNEYGGFSPATARLYDASSVRLDRHPHVLITPQAAVVAPSSALEKALACWRRCIAPDQARAYNVFWPTSSQSWPVQSSPDPEAARAEFHERFLRFEQKRRGSWEHRYGFRWSMTESGDALVCGDDDVSFVAFSDSTNRLRPEALVDFVISAERISDLLREHAGMKQAVPLEWDALSPERFEELCYDVIVRCGRFEETTIRRHGKTRSRDGGRDIEAWTQQRFNKPCEKWLYQCKFVMSGSALAGSRVTVADVVDQYSASGFGVMTNEVIDSTLYDKLDAIAARRQIAVDPWDGRRLERFVASRPDLMQRYFPNHGKES